MQHLVIEIRQGDAITVTRTRRLSPNCHLLGVSTELADLIIQMLVKTRKEGRQGTYVTLYPLNGEFLVVFV